MRRSLRLIRLTVAAELRGPGLRLFAGIGILAAAVWSWDQGAIPGATALVLSLWLGRVYGIAAGLWFAYTGLRDQNEQLGAVIRTKPIDGAEWNALLWCSGVALWLLMLAVTFAAAALGQALSGAPAPLAFLAAFARSALILLSVATLCFALSRMLRSPLGGILTVFAWFCAVAGLDYIPTFLKPDYSQNGALLLTAGLTLLAVVALGIERFRRGELRAAKDWLPLPLVGGCLAAVTAVAAYGAVNGTGEKLAQNSPLWDAITRQDLQQGQRVPGFWLHDVNGRLVTTAEHRGKILAVYLFSSQDTDTAGNLAALEQVQQELGPRGTRVIAICLSEDRLDPWILARAAHYHFPLVADPTTVRTSPPHSSLAIAYRAETLPMLIVTDRRLRVRNITPGSTLEAGAMRALLQERLTEEPQ